MRLRRTLPLNGETSFADTAAAFAALPSAERTRLADIQVRRHSYTKNHAAPVPLVRSNPHSGIQSLHSPLWCPRPPRQIPVEVDGRSVEASRAFLDEIEAHVLQPEFRYDHVHEPGDVTIWDLFATIHIAPPIKENIQSIDDARLFYRISCKGRTGVDAAEARSAGVDREAHLSGLHDAAGSHRSLMVPPRGIEPRTFSLQVSCSAG